MADSYSELLTLELFNLNTFSNDGAYDELVPVRDIPFQSLCMRRALPFHGLTHIAYLPGERILALSRFARVGEMFARDLQLQERLTTQIVVAAGAARAEGVGVVLEAEHLCMSVRGVQKLGTRTVTASWAGSR